MYSRNMNEIKETRVFMNGPSQAVRIPKEFRMEAKIVSIKRVENGLMILPKEGRFDAMRAALNDFTDDFLEKRDQECFETRDSL